MKVLPTMQQSHFNQVMNGLVLLNVASTNTLSYSEEELDLLESVAFQLGSAIKRIYLTKQEQEIALVQERNRLARDLHDSVNQLLFSVTLTCALV